MQNQLTATTVSLFSNHHCLQGTARLALKGHTLQHRVVQICFQDVAQSATHHRLADPVCYEASAWAREVACSIKLLLQSLLTCWKICNQCRNC